MNEHESDHKTDQETDLFYDLSHDQYTRKETDQQYESRTTCPDPVGTSDTMADQPGGWAPSFC